VPPIRRRVSSGQHDPEREPEAFEADRVNRELRRVFSQGDGLPVN